MPRLKVVHHSRVLAHQARRRVLAPGRGVLVMCEAVPTRSRWNWIGPLIVALDEGDFISPTLRAPSALGGDGPAIII